jgi:hypothetical protein
MEKKSNSSAGELNPCRPTSSLVTILTELPLLLKREKEGTRKRKWYGERDKY